MAGKDRRRNIARERYERRLQARAQARAKVRQRWAVGGSAAGVVAIVAIVLAFTLPGNGKNAASLSSPATSGSPVASGSPASSAPPPPPPTTAPGCTSTPLPEASRSPNFPILPSGVDSALASYPTITIPAGPVPTTVQTKDLVVGSGETVKADDTVTINYVGMNYVNCQVFDSSWGHGQYLTLPANQFVPGFTKGVTGMKVGGRREIIIPPSEGYGTEGASGAIQPNEELVFVVDVIATSHSTASPSAPAGSDAATPPPPPPTS